MCARLCVCMCAYVPGNFLSSSTASNPSRREAVQQPHPALESSQSASLSEHPSLQVGVVDRVATCEVVEEVVVVEAEAEAEEEEKYQFIASGDWRDKNTTCCCVSPCCACLRARARARLSERDCAARVARGCV